MNANLSGSLWMVLAMAGFAVEDAIFKGVTRTVPPGYALMAFGLTGALIYMGISRALREPVFAREMIERRLLLRSASEIVGRLFYALALAFTPLSTTSAILQATPLVVALGAALILGEKVGPRRWVAMVIGFAGVIVILRPTPDAFRADALFALVGMMGFAGRDLATRASPPHVSRWQLGTLGFLVVAAAGAVIMTASGEGLVTLTPSESGRVVLTAIFGVIAYTSLTQAMRTGAIGVVAPFRYTRLLFALVIAVTFFDETPDLWTYAGGAIVVLSGIYTLLRGARSTRET